MREKKKLTRKQIQEKYENLKIDTERRMQEMRRKVSELEIGAAQVSQLMDVLMGYIIEAYGTEGQLVVPKSDKRYQIESRVRDVDGVVTGYIYTATEVKDDEEVQERKDND